MATSAVPGAITALLALLDADAGLVDVDVIDGPPTDDVATQDVLAVGWSPEGDQSAELAQNFNSAGARTRDEDFQINCYIESWTGDSTFSVIRARVFEIFGLFEQALRATNSNPDAPNLGGAVLWAHLTRGLLQQSRSEQGIKAGLTFTVTCRARI